MTLRYLFILFSLPAAGGFSSLPKNHAAPALSIVMRATVAPAGATGIYNSGSIKLSKEAKELLDAVESKEKGVRTMILAQTAPATRVAFPETFGFPPGSFPPGKLVASLKALGVDLVLDTNTAADLTIMEEGTELMHKLQSKLNSSTGAVKGKEPSSNMPLFTSCCPGWILTAAKMDPELADCISTSKSPHMMYGAIMKEYSKDLLGVPAKQVYFCSVMPCVRKRGESDCAVFEKNGIRDIDNVITTKDLGDLLHLKGIDPSQLEVIPFDSPFQIDDGGDGTGSGAGQLFGVTGGVMEAAVRTVYEVVTGQPLPRIELDQVRGLEGLKEATIPLHTEDGKGLPIDLRVAVVNGLGNAKKLVKSIKAGEVSYDFVEIMACPAGCIGGGGQPKSRENDGILADRMEVVYNLDRTLPIRRSHLNPIIQKIYKRFLGEYGSEKAHELLHVDPFYGERPDLGK